MSRDSRCDILFEPLKIGPVTTKNRFYQMPHCSGMGWQGPNSLNEMHAIKAEGGWGVVNTEYCSIHPSSDDLLCPYASLWDDSDMRAHRIMTEKVHEHGALAGAELWSARSNVALLISLAPRDLRLLTLSCRKRLKKGASKTSANASAATCVTPAISWAFLSAARKTQRWVW